MDDKVWLTWVLNSDSIQHNAVYSTLTFEEQANVGLENGKAS